jgi:hypothetical protein
VCERTHGTAHPSLETLSRPTTRYPHRGWMAEVLTAVATGAALVLAGGGAKSLLAAASADHDKKKETSLRKLDLSRLKRRLVNEDGLRTPERAIEAIHEYRRFLRILRDHPSEDLLLPCAAVDAVWQRHLLDTQAYQLDCSAIFGAHAHRVYPQDGFDAASGLARTRALYQETYGAEPPSLWNEVPTVAPAYISISPALGVPPAPFSRQGIPWGRALSTVEVEDLEWVGAAVAKELPLKQTACKHGEPLKQIVCGDPSLAVVEYKKFLRMMIDDSGAWFTPSKLVDELWHRHMLDSVKYCRFCERVAGSYLHHTPHYGEPHSFHDPGFLSTLKTYKQKFGAPAPRDFWGTVGESGGGGCGGGGGGCGGGGCGAGTGGVYGRGVGGGGVGGGVCFVICCPCIALIVVLAIVRNLILSVAYDSCDEEGSDGASLVQQCDRLRGGHEEDFEELGYTKLLQGCFDRTVMNGTADWESHNARIGSGKTCADYKQQALCNICSKASNNEEKDYTHPAGPGWNPEWGTGPGDQQYENYGMTAVDACCVCGGGSPPPIDAAQCRDYGDACQQMDDCAEETAGLVLGLVFIVGGGCALFAIKCGYDKKKAKDAEFAKRREEALAAEAAATTVATANPAAGGAAQTTQMMSVTAPAGVSAGQQMTIETPSGQMQVAVPAGVGPGMTFQVAVPAPAPVVAVAAAQQTTQMMSVTAPAGVSAGQQMMIQTPSGQMQVAVPAGVGPGMTFQVAVPAPAPVVAVAVAQVAVATPTAKVVATPAEATPTL